ncbi:hypothetical protein LCGC14_0643420 [marine sediment metagenome]|uniref:Clp R domain-containing protein n=1 Tax=marine sediment metagenome TaxID=412755 RepID=A0A0F9TK45_9ZZZZ
MYERFTDRARKVLQQANQEARRLNHEYLGTEHVLLGLIKEGSGVAATALKNLDVDWCDIGVEVEKFMQSGPDIVTTGRLPQTPRTKQVLTYSMEEARNLNHNYVGTEHILLGLLHEQKGIACLVLTNLGLKLEDVREEVLNLLGGGPDTVEKENKDLRMALARWMTHPSAECVPTQAIEMGRRALAGKDIADLDVVVIARKAEAEVERLRRLRAERDEAYAAYRVEHFGRGVDAKAYRAEIKRLWETLRYARNFLKFAANSEGGIVYHIDGVLGGEFAEAGKEGE